MAALGIVAGASEPKRTAADAKDPSAAPIGTGGKPQITAQSTVLQAWSGAVVDLRRQLPAVLGRRTTALLYAQVCP